jgi:hypothetical protein
VPRFALLALVYQLRSLACDPEAGLFSIRSLAALLQPYKAQYEVYAGTEPSFGVGGAGFGSRVGQRNDVLSGSWNEKTCERGVSVGLMLVGVAMVGWMTLQMLLAMRVREYAGALFQRDEDMAFSLGSILDTEQKTASRSEIAKDYILTWNQEELPPYEADVKERMMVEEELEEASLEYEEDERDRNVLGLSGDVTLRFPCIRPWGDVS